MSTDEYEFLPDEWFIQEDEESVEVNGFEVLLSQENLVKEMFNKNPNLISNFELKIQQIKNSYMKILLDLVDTLCQSTKKLSWKDLHKADNTLIDLTSKGLNVSWLDKAYLKKEEQIISEERIRDLEEQLKKQKLTLSNLESDLEEEKALAAIICNGLIDFVLMKWPLIREI